MADRIVKLDAVVPDFNVKMVASSKLINRVKTNRVRMLWLTAVTKATAITAIGTLFSR